MESDIYDAVLDATDRAGTGWYLPYPLGFQVPLASVLLLEIVLGASSNLAVLALYGLRPGLVDSLSNVVTMNLHVLDALTCVACAPLTVGVVLLPLGRDVALLCCFHEACVTFSSVATAGNLLAISLDRYDMSVRPARRVLTPGRTALLLAGVWLLALLGFFLPFVEMEFLRGPGPGPAARQNRTVLCVSVAAYHAELGLYSHLLLQVPAFFATAAAMLVAYARILRALHRDVGSRVWRSRSQRRKCKKRSVPGAGPGEATGLSQAAPPCPRPMRVQASVSVIVALRRALKRHRARRQRQKRVFRMSLSIVCTFLVCWAPISVANLLVLCRGPSRLLVKLRLAFLAMAYGTTVFHPLLYALARQKLRAALRGRVKKRVVSVLQVEPSPGGSVIHNSWAQPPKGRRAGPPGSEGAERCLSETLKA
ncbi:G-protein coupled receptor 22-like [Emydura macquarii macquarii]|uniref:G-protein coupled receptor 22-like n=1 Tax=Emydura macquarii macquarii TaxID=1129001 RepID=UPI00352B7D5F